MHSDYYSTSALNPITWLFGEASWQDSSSLAGTQKAEWVILSNKLLRQLRSVEHHEWEFIVTLDNS
jgi:hypothetical protein